MRGRPEEQCRNPNPSSDNSTGRVLSFFTPLGQFYNGEIWKGIVILTLYVVSIAIDATVFGAPIGTLMMIGTWIWAFTDARKIQRGLKERW